MPRPGGLRPADYVEGFPDGPVRADAPVGVTEVAHVARALRAEIDDRGETVAGLARAAELDRTTLHDLLAGRAFIDIVTLARLEHALDITLWPRR